MLIKLYHGTSEENLNKILKDGANKLYLTLDSEQAKYYAECASEEDETNPKIIVIEVNIEMLHADLPSFNEPLSYILEYNGFDNEDDWHEAINNGTIPYPEKSDWKTSLKYTQSVVALGNIKPEQIIEDGDLSEEDIEKALDLLKSSEKKPKPK